MSQEAGCHQKDEYSRKGRESEGVTSNGWLRLSHDPKLCDNHGTFEETKEVQGSLGVEEKTENIHRETPQFSSFRQGRGILRS